MSGSQEMLSARAFVARKTGRRADGTWRSYESSESLSRCVGSTFYILYKVSTFTLLAVASCWRASAKSRSSCKICLYICLRALNQACDLLTFALLNVRKNNVSFRFSIESLDYASRLSPANCFYDTGRSCLKEQLPRTDFDFFVSSCPPDNANIFPSVLYRPKNDYSVGIQANIGRKELSAESLTFLDCCCHFATKAIVSIKLRFFLDPFGFFVLRREVWEIFILLRRVLVFFPTTPLRHRRGGSAGLGMEAAAISRMLRRKSPCRTPSLVWACGLPILAVLSL